MRLMGILVLVVGIGLAGGALYYSKVYFDQIEARNAMLANMKPKTVPVAVATRQLQYGDRLVAKDVRLVDWPEASIPPGAVNAVETLVAAEGSDAGERIVLRTIEIGEPVLEMKVTGFGEDMRMALRLGEGMRAVSIQIDAVSGVSGLIGAGDRVDILLTEGAGETLSSRVVLQDIPVIAIDQAISNDGRSARLGQTATVEVDQRQAQILALAQEVGRLSMTLRGLYEEAPTDGSTPVAIRLDDVIPREKAPEAVQSGTDIRVRRGVKVEEERIDDRPTETQAGN